MPAEMVRKEIVKNHLPKREGVGSLPLVSDTNLYPIIELANTVKIAYLKKWQT